MKAGARVKLRQTSLPTSSPTCRSGSSSSSIAWRTPSRTRVREGALLFGRRTQGAREPARSSRKISFGRVRYRRGWPRGHRDVVSRWTGVPIMSIKEEESQKLLRIEEELHKRIISAGQSDCRPGPRHPSQPRWPQEPKPAIGSFPVPWPHGRWQDRSRPHAGAIHVWQRQVARSLDMSEFMEKHSVSEADRLASWICGLRRGRPAYRTCEARAVFRCAARRNRERRIRMSSTFCCRCLKTAS